MHIAGTFMFENSLTTIPIATITIAAIAKEVITKATALSGRAITNTWETLESVTTTARKRCMTLYV